MHAKKDRQTDRQTLLKTVLPRLPLAWVNSYVVNQQAMQVNHRFLTARTAYSKLVYSAVYTSQSHTAGPVHFNENYSFQALTNDPHSGFPSV